MVALHFILVFGVLAAAQEIPVVGVRSGVNTRTGEMPIRRNINSIYDERGPQWDLYIAALTAMQDANETDPTSYFQLAGIHGQPYMAWSGGGPQTGADAGYCPHNQGLFGTWHRGYLSLYEVRTTVPQTQLRVDRDSTCSQQVLVRQAKRIATSYPEPHKRKYLEAAESLRIAYWDWAEDHRVPPVTAMPTVIVNKPVAGLVKPAAVRNPLYRFKYPQSALDGYFGRFDGTNSTSRCANDGETYPETANEKLASFNLKEKVFQYNVFVKAATFHEMVSAQSQGANFEGPHGEVHVAAACGQDLLTLSTSAFEPLFWLHHANVDRLIAFWQALHFENANIRFSYSSNEMFATPAGTTVTPQYPIWPFMGSGGSPLTSESVTHVRDWGYTYAPMRFWDQAPGETKMAVSRTVNILYGPSEQQRKRRLSPQGLRRRKGVAKREYFAKVEVERGELELPCQVQLYLKGKLAGSFTLLDMPKKGKSYDEIPLSRGVDVAGFRGLSSKSVLGAIEYGLEVVINNLDGTTTPLDRVPSLKIEVEDVSFVVPDSLNELPTIGAVQCRAAKARPFTISY
ncbi:Tyrosinase [Colletotrichum tanaceti]|uniref:Tyrosinase n=1 Tax=Colletotrichum tanaceti TaxID=1306861 RepID=A0A4U6XL76_9PEZI|nr:Tyrosinase [Colletotrichum tanaceti]TKW56400.1 Tyrosinase [Colletotrichum tanaceti]